MTQPATPALRLDLLDIVRVLPQVGYPQDIDPPLPAVERPWYDTPAAGAAVEVTSTVQARAHVAATVNGFAGDPDLVSLATSELATNALIAAPTGRVTTWNRSRELVVEVADRCPGFDATVAGYVPPATGDLCGGGPWIVRQITADSPCAAAPPGPPPSPTSRAA